LHTFRVDSPLKGHFSGIDETKLSYQIATVDTAARTMTVREVLWNANPQNPNSPITWGASTTVALAPRPTAINRQCSVGARGRPLHTRISCALSVHRRFRKSTSRNCALFDERCARYGPGLLGRS